LISLLLNFAHLILIACSIWLLPGALLFFHIFYINSSSHQSALQSEGKCLIVLILSLFNAGARTLHLHMLSVSTLYSTHVLP